MSVFDNSTSYRPFKYQWAVTQEVNHRIAMNWHEQQVEMADDLLQWRSKDGMATKYVPHEVHKSMVEKLLLLFTEMDVSVGSLYVRLMPYVGNNEIRMLWGTFLQREIAHARSYALAAETFGFTNNDWSEFREYVEMNDKLDLMAQDCGDLSNKLNFAKQLGVLLLGEGISLFGAFACLLNLSRFGIIRNFNTINEYSLKDEADHVDGNIKVLSEVRKELTAEENAELDRWLIDVSNAYNNAEHKFLDLVFGKYQQQDFTLEEAKDYIDYLTKLRQFQLGIIGSNNVPVNKLEWIEDFLYGSRHTNFFEARVTDYSHNHLVGDVDYSKFEEALLDKQMLEEELC